MEDIAQLADFLLLRGFHMTSLELLAEMRSKNQSPPPSLTAFFSDPAKFESVRNNAEGLGGEIAQNPHLEPPRHRLIASPIFFDDSDHCGESEEKSENFDIYDVSDVAPESKEASLREDESKALLKYQLRLAKEELENLKNSKIDSGCGKKDETEISCSSEFVDALVLDYLAIGIYRAE